MIGTRAFSEFCFDNNARVEWMLPIGSAHAHDGTGCGQVLEDWFVEHDHADIANLFPDSGDIGQGDVDGFLNWLAESGKEGFLIACAAVVRTYQKQGGYMFSWGHYHTSTIYAGTLEEASEKFKAWVHASAESDKKRKR